ncbi:hypothetical protein H0I23_00925 [Cellulophaga sp. HaHaR_3_176]|uniref:hypothetical protein n=1 Tax=Cellulophaga sp. HaHaR_3_176 TaxID=1942464 RepID=UPI001C1F8EF0|nr:hypothetical protein [Cellulophaga sp. HaHaR_3_176]QWX84246.1 hypothetical protein H0I23_00925 [Cellulophaga sp. HaHaR_3_176]
MGTFLTMSFEARWAGNKEKTNLTQKVIGYIADNLRDMVWQESISNQLCKVDGHHTNLRIVLRLFDIKDIEEGKLKSLARYKKKDDKLVIDQMLVINKYSDLPENEMRIKMCDEIVEYVEQILIKYKDRFQDFNAIAFIPLFKERMEEIKEYKLKDDYVNE